MRITAQNAKEFASNVMDARQLADFNSWSETSYETVAELLETETDETVAEFYN